MRSKKPHVEPERLGVNPFAAELVIELHKMALPGQWENDGGVLIPAEMEVERVKYCKVFADSSRRKDMSVLRGFAKELLLWVLYEASSGQDWVWINKYRFMKESSVGSYSTYKRGVDELVAAKFLQVTVIKDVYWINPHYFFVGSRGRVFPKKIVRK